MNNNGFDFLQDNQSPRFGNWVYNQITDTFNHSEIPYLLSRREGVEYWISHLKRNRWISFQDLRDLKRAFAALTPVAEAVHD